MFGAPEHALSRKSDIIQPTTERKEKEDEK